jgi:hypothetical protein
MAKPRTNKGVGALFSAEQKRYHQYERPSIHTARPWRIILRKLFLLSALTELAQALDNDKFKYGASSALKQ